MRFMNISRRPAGRTLAIAAATIAATTLSSGVSAQQVREPLPVDVAASLRTHVRGAPISFSPDGEWLAHTVETDETIPRDTLNSSYGPTGFPFGNGDGRSEATLTNVKTGEVIRLGGAKGASWSPVWSPDGKRVAFFSDEDGELGVWVWELSTRTARRFPGAIVRAFYRHETIHWMNDSQTMLVKILPAGVTVAEANAVGFTAKGQGRFPEVGPGEPSVVVRRAGMKQGNERTQDPVATDTLTGDMRVLAADLALLDLRTGGITRLAEDVSAVEWSISPDQKHVAAMVLQGYVANTWQRKYELIVADVATGTSRSVKGGLRIYWGREWSWSPDGSTIAYIDSGPQGDGSMVLVSVADGTTRVLKSESSPRFAVEVSDYPPVWEENGRSLYAVTAGEFWRVDVASGKASKVANFPEWKIAGLVHQDGRNTIWTTDGGRTAWVVANDRDGLQSGLLGIDLRNGKSRVALQERKTYSTRTSLSANSHTGDIAFVSTSQQELGDAWLINTKNNRVRRATRLNPELDRYELGTSRIIEWKTADGVVNKGALLLPPGYRPGQRVPLILDIYGGGMGTKDVNNFGFSNSLPAYNMHLFATRGYAVLKPDAPVRTGHTMRDIYDVVMAATDAAVEQGYADPDRLAIHGHSYGSFSTLAVITQTTRFKAAFIGAAVLHPELTTDYLRGSTAYWEVGQGNMGGTPWEYPDRYRENSPIYLFDRIETPLFIEQGSLDGADLNPSEAMFNALERLGKNVEYRVYESEGHVITQKRHIIDVWQARLDFLAKHLGLTVDANGRIKP